jgi:hypothetical protein
MNAYIANNVLKTFEQVPYEIVSDTFDIPKCRAAIGMRFEPKANQVIVDQLVSRMCAEIDLFLEVKFHHLNLAINSILSGCKLSAVDPITGATYVLLVWEDNIAFQSNVTNAYCDLSEALNIASVCAYVSWQKRPAEAVTVDFVLMAKETISDAHVSMLKSYMESGEFSLAGGKDYLIFPNAKLTSTSVSGQWSK